MDTPMDTPPTDTPPTGTASANAMPRSTAPMHARAPETASARAAGGGRIAVIDNYDSFTWNLVQYLRELGAAVDVYRNDAIGLDALEASAPAALLISPGPGTPDGAGISLGVVARFAGRVPLLGVCLGHQSIGQHYGGRIARAREIMHGKLSRVHHAGRGVFAGLPSPFTATRYHSLVIAPDSVPDALEVTAWTEDGHGRPVEIMGVRHREHALEGVQFHPESISSEHGHALLGNFLSTAGLSTAGLSTAGLSTAGLSTASLSTAGPSETVTAAASPAGLARATVPAPAGASS